MSLEEKSVSVFSLDPDLYRRYKDEVLQLSNAFQHNIKIDLPNRKRGLSDQEIAGVTVMVTVAVPVDSTVPSFAL